MASAETRRSGGRPTAQAAALLETTILDAATSAFLADGYAETTIEAIARTCGVAKRTIYARWSGKPALFRSVLDRLMTSWMAAADDLPEPESLEAALDEMAIRVLDVALTPEAVALHRLLIAEGARFPELSVMTQQAGAGEGTVRIATLLDRFVARGTLRKLDTVFAAEQFLHLLLAGPQRRALMGRPLDEQQLRAWRQATLTLFLSGVKSAWLPGGSN
jgi:TetR/AcrR family transcriptional repressor of mexJK operon